MSADASESGLKVVDAFDLEPDVRALLKPARDGRRTSRGGGTGCRATSTRSPPTRRRADIRLTPHFGLNEFLLVDLKEAQRLRSYPRYVPCAVRAPRLLPRAAARGGGRPAAHRRQRRLPLARAQARRRAPRPHMWGTAADLYRDRLGRPARAGARSRRTTAWPRSSATTRGSCPTATRSARPTTTCTSTSATSTLVPREISEDRLEAPQAGPRFAFEERRQRRPPGLADGDRTSSELGRVDRPGRPEVRRSRLARFLLWYGRPAIGSADGATRLIAASR